jgi:hypothetical protein
MPFADAAMTPGTADVPSANLPVFISLPKCVRGARGPGMPKAASRRSTPKNCSHLLLCGVGGLCGEIKDRSRPLRDRIQGEPIMRTFGNIAIIAIVLSSVAALQAQDLPQFREHVVTRDLKFGYQLVAADLNGDGKMDLIGIDERASELSWFENPGWERHILATDVPRQLNADCWDFDHDGIPEVALAFRFETNPEKSIGNLVLLKSGSDIRQPWQQKEIDRVPTAHRVRWIDPKGDGRKVLMLGPMVGMKARAPLYDDDAPIYIYRPGEWKRETFPFVLHGILHAINPVRWDRKSREQLLTASFLGLHRFEWKNNRWVSTQISKGDTRACPECGSSEVRLGWIGKKRFLAAIEPWHGNQVAVYLPQGSSWIRTVLEDGMTNGHALAVGDLDGDGKDEIVSGFRGKGFKLYLFKSTDNSGRNWKKTVLDDGGLAAADCKIEDFTGDGKPDIACIGASTGNIKLYENLGIRK